MRDNTFYFTHDYHARNDRKLIKLRLKLGLEGLGIYWCLVEMLYEECGEIALSETYGIAEELRTQNEKVTSVINDFELFQFNANVFWSESVKSRLAKRLEKSEKAKASASHRWSNANAMQTQCDSNAKKERKGKEKKENITIAFEDFWKAYPKKKDKSPAEKAWNRLKPEDQQKAFDHIPTYSANTSEPKYLKYPATYLHSYCWQDEETPVVAMGKVLKAVGVNERDQIIYEDGTVVPPGSYNDLADFKAGKKDISHFNRRIA